MTKRKTRGLSEYYEKRERSVLDFKGIFERMK